MSRNEKKLQQLITATWHRQRSMSEIDHFIGERLARIQDLDEDQEMFELAGI